MIKINNTDVFGFKGALRGIRNPLNSHKLSDTQFLNNKIIIGNNDLNLGKKLCSAGSDHRKFIRMIHLQCDVIAPLYWWKEYDTYKISTTSNSDSTMHCVHKKEFELSDFSYEQLSKPSKKLLECYIIRTLNIYRDKFNKTKDKRYWWQIIQLLPSSYNQKRTVDLNYETLRNIYQSRKNHKLDEWIEFCRFIEKLPYAKELIIN